MSLNSKQVLFHQLNIEKFGDITSEKYTYMTYLQFFQPVLEIGRLGKI